MTGGLFLLSCTSGVAEYTDTLFGQAATNPTVLIRNWEPEELVQLIDEQDPFFAPGEGWQYSNPDSALQKVALNTTSLGLIIKYNCLSS